MSRFNMLLRIAGASLRVQPGKLLLSLASLGVGATLASAFLSLYFELPQQLSGEFRALGPNLIVAPRGEAQTVPAGLEREIINEIPGVPTLPWLYAVGETEGQAVILAGTDLLRIRAMHPTWQGIPAQLPLPDVILAGEKAATLYGWQPGATVRVAYGSQEVSLQLAGIVSTGGSEDSQLLLPLPVLDKLTGQAGRISLIQVAASGNAAQVESTWQRISTQLANAAVEVRPLRPVLASEALVVMKVRWLMLGLAAVVLALVMFSVLTTVSGRILDRRKDIGVMKALGGSDSGIARFFLAESTAQALLAGTVGSLIGFGLAEWASHRMFDSSIAWRWDVAAVVLAITVAAALIATALPARWIHRLDAAVILRGE